MKTYKEFITELNKFEKFVAKQGIKALKKFNPREPLKSIKKDVFGTVKAMRSDPDNPFVSPRRGAENLVKQFQRTVPGQKGENIMKLKDRTGKPKYTKYDPTRVRQGDDPQAKVTGAAQSMRGRSKKSIRGLDKDMKDMGKQFPSYKQDAENARSVLKNTGDQHSAIYKAPDYRINPTDKKIDSLYPKNRLGAPTTTNLPKGAVPDASKKIDAKSVIKPLKRNKPK